MKKSFFFGMAAALLLAAACTSSDEGFRTETRQFDQSTDRASVKINAELPVATTPGAAVMRQTLVDVMDQAFSLFDSEGGKRQFPRYEGDINDSEALFSYYEQQGTGLIERLSTEFFEERAEGIRSSTTLTDAEKEEYIAQTPGYGFEFNLKKTYETERIAVFDSENYIYLGGAHGGIDGAGPMTFDKKTGMRVRDFFEPGSVRDMQPLLRQGMLSYFKERMDATDTPLEMHLHLKDDGLIPLPQWAPMPTEEGLKFIYQQYEVAAYAEGMPEFTLPYGDVAPYLFPEVKADLGL